MGMAGAEEFSGGESQGAANGQKEKILVSIRMRPLNEKERVRNDISDWECINKNTVIFRGNISDRGLFPSAYTFDRVFGSETSTKQVYEETAKEVSLSVLRGINSSVFAYGQTSSGKTYTMSGITLYAVADIFNYIEKHREREYILKFSAIEIYNEAVRDLLSFDSTPLRLLDDPEKGTVIERLAEETLRDWNHFQELLSICEAQRQIGETSMNEMSSRSHQILRLTIESSAREFLGAENSSTLAASVNFVDLAGSERASQTSSAGARLKEGSHINRSLLTLGTVIRKLSKGRSAHIPYRDSKLTRILHNALGGNARTAIICTISPARSHVEQSRNTLLFANCAKEVSTNAQVNVLMSDKALVKQLQRELARMENELRNLGSAPATSDPTELLEEKEHLIKKMEAEIQELIQQRDLAHSRVQDLLRSSAEDNFSKQDTCSEPESEDKIGPLHCRVPQEKFNEDKTFERLSSNMSYLQLPDTPEDNFLLDGSSPRLSLSTPYSRRLEETFPRIDEDAEDTCKEVRCIEVEEPCVETKEGPNNHLIVPDETETKADTASTVKQDVITHFEKSERDASNVNIDISIDDINKKIQDMQKTINCLVSLYPQQKSERDASDINANISYDNLNKKIQDIQKTINCLVSLYPQGQSPDSSEVDATSCKSFTTRRSRSCRTLVMAVPPFQWPEKIEQSENPTPDEFEKDSSANSVSFHKRFASSSSSEEFTRRDSLIPASTDVSDSEGVASTQSISLSKLSKVQPNTSDDPDTANHNNQPTAESRAPNTYINHGSVTKSQTTDQVWASEFEKKRREIIELWDMCKVPLVHRTYFFLLFQGDPSDSVYMEVELRRLSFLKGTVFTGTKAFTDVLASSSKALTREREMLSRRMHKKLMRKERESLYQKWGIGLSTKQRSIQLAHRLWSDTKDFSHVAMSAELVAKLFGLVETSRAPREMFELSFSPARQMGMSWRSFSSWNH